VWIASVEVATTPDSGTRHDGTDHLGAGYGVLFGDAIALTADPEVAAWLVLSVLSARRLRADTMPDADRLEAGVTALTLQALADRTIGTRRSHHAAEDGRDVVERDGEYVVQDECSGLECWQKNG
jgi:hypothetical protein